MAMGDVLLGRGRRPGRGRALLEADERWWGDLERGLVTDPDPPGERWGVEPPDPDTSPRVDAPPQDGWWGGGRPGGGRRLPGRVSSPARAGARAEAGADR